MVITWKDRVKENTLSKLNSLFLNFTLDNIKSDMWLIFVTCMSVMFLLDATSLPCINFHEEQMKHFRL